MNSDLPDAGEALKSVLERIGEKMAAIGLSPKKVLEYFTMFTVLTVVYYGYFVYAAKMNTCAPVVVITLSYISVHTLKIFLFTGWPFALMAGYDPLWRNKDAGNIFLVAYIAANVLWYHRTGCGFCMLSAPFRAVPYVFCAWVGHSLGALRYRLRRDAGDGF